MPFIYGSAIGPAQILSVDSATTTVAFAAAQPIDPPMAGILTTHAQA